MDGRKDSFSLSASQSDKEAIMNKSDTNFFLEVEGMDKTCSRP